MEVVGSNLQFTPTMSAPDIEERERNVFQSTLIISCIYQPKTTVTDIVRLENAPALEDVNLYRQLIGEEWKI